MPVDESQDEVDCEASEKEKNAISSILYDESNYFFFTLCAIFPANDTP